MANENMTAAHHHHRLYGPADEGILVHTHRDFGPGSPAELHDWFTEVECRGVHCLLFLSSKRGRHERSILTEMFSDAGSQP